MTICAKPSTQALPCMAVCAASAAQLHQSRNRRRGRAAGVNRRDCFCWADNTQPSHSSEPLTCVRAQERQVQLTQQRLAVLFRVTGGEGEKGRGRRGGEE